MHIEDFVRRLQGVKRRGEKYEAQCPAHDDRKASLSVGVGREGGIVVHCHAGCFPEDVLEAMALTFKDLAPEQLNGQQNGSHPAQTVYRYDDEEGNCLFEKVRTADKQFWQRLPGSRKGGLGNVRRVLYRLPDLRKTSAGQLVFIVEGEKDADNLWRLGLAATTNSEGASKAGAASKWKDDYTAWLARHLPDRRFIILPDNDEAGSWHAGQVYESMRAAGLQVVPLLLPDLTESGDVSDWLRGGGSKEELLALVDALPDGGAEDPARAAVVTTKVRQATGFNARELLSMELRDPKWAVPGYISEGLNILAGGQKLGKSWLAFDLSLGIAGTGLALGTVEVETGDVLYLALEDTIRRLQDRLQKLLRDDPPPERLEIHIQWPRIGEGGEEWLELWLKEHPEARLVVIDTLKKLRPTKAKSGNPYDEDYDFMGQLKAIADRHEVAFLVLHHIRKMKADDPFDMVSGTMGLTAAADATLVMQRIRGHTDASLHITGRDIEEREEAIAWDKDTGMWTVIGDAEEYRRSEGRREILALMEKTGAPMTPKEIAEILGRNRNTVRSLIARMAAKSEVQMTLPGKYQIVSPPAG